MLCRILFLRRERLLLGLLLPLLLACTLPRYLSFFRRPGLVAALAWSVAGKKIVIDPGHGGSDPGAVGEGGVAEKDVNLAVARRLALLLSQAGAEVFLTRTGDYHLGEAEVPGPEDLARRVGLVARHGAELFVSIHGNSFPSSQWWGAQVFYHPDSPEGRRLACLIQQEFLKALGESYRWAMAEDFFVLRRAGVPAVVVEVGFLSNPREEALLSDPAYQAKLAWCIYAGIVRFFGGEPAPSPPFS